MHKYIICGPQGSGKGTQSRLLSQAHDFVHISIGDMFRWHMQHHTKVAARITRIMHSGHLVSDDIVEKVVRERLEQHDFNYGFVLDGFPRTRPQAEYLFENWDVDRVIYLDVPDEIVFERVMRRAKQGLGSGFTKRADDNPAALKVRLEEYYTKTKPLLELYRQKGRLLTVDGTKTISEVYSDVSKALGLSPLTPAADLLASVEANV
ncbi:MAG: adenylate kinase [Acidobacteria bacterium]|nr:adenylate kinase [Acidobacteriota bacterium]MDA1233228.1 adenylate kinase [Acidobacteriota bacterium]